MLCFVFFRTNNVFFVSSLVIRFFLVQTFAIFRTTYCQCKLPEGLILTQCKEFFRRALKTGSRLRWRDFVVRSFSLENGYFFFGLFENGLCSSDCLKRIAFHCSSSFHVFLHANNFLVWWRLWEYVTVVWQHFFGFDCFTLRWYVELSRWG